MVAQPSHKSTWIFGKKLHLGLGQRRAQNRGLRFVKSMHNLVQQEPLAQG